MPNYYSLASVREIVSKISERYLAVIEAQKRELSLLQAENDRLKEQRAVPSELDLEEILNPSMHLELEKLCKEMGLME